MASVGMDAPATRTRLSGWHPQDFRRELLMNTSTCPSKNTYEEHSNLVLWVWAYAKHPRRGGNSGARLRRAADLQPGA